jgi:glycerophosphoryl diester phosphodiesterase
VAARIAYSAVLVLAILLISGYVVRRSLEAWDLQRNLGCRFFEVDFQETGDGKLVAAHDGLEEELGLPGGFTHAQFMEARLFDRYTPLDADAIADLLAADPDWTLVSDIKTGFGRVIYLLCETLEAKGVSCLERVVPQIYNIHGDLETVNEMGFPRVIFTLYGTRLSDQGVIDAVRKHENIVAVTMSNRRWNSHLVNALSGLDVLTYVHTINGEERIAALRQSGIYGIYTDDSCTDGS